MEEKIGNRRDLTHLLRLLFVIVAIFIVVRAFRSIYQLPLRPPPEQADALQSALRVSSIPPEALFMFIGVLLLAAQLMFWSGILNRLYAPSAERPSTGGLAGLLAHVYALVFQAGLLYWLAMLLTGHERQLCALITVAFFALRGIHFLLTHLVQRRHVGGPDVLTCALADLVSCAILSAFLLLHEQFDWLHRIAPEGAAALVAIVDAVIVYFTALKLLGGRRESVPAP